MKYRMRFPVMRALLPVAGIACAFATASPAAAQTVNCASLSSNVVYVAGSTAVQPFLAVIAKNLATATPPVSIVYQGQGSCTGVGYLSNPDDATQNSISGVGTYWDSSGTALSCNLTAITGDPVDVGVSDVFAASCGQTPPSQIHDFHGPVQSMEIVVPSTSTQVSISAEAAYMVFGFGADTAAHTISPWNDPTTMQVRSAASGTQQMVTAAISQAGSGLTAAKWKGVSNSGSGGVLTNLTNAASAGNADKAIGILAADFTDRNRSSLKVLYYQHVGQTCGYQPDSKPTAFDKQNTRDGHYAIWGPMHLLARVDASGKPLRAPVQTILDILTGAVEPAFDLVTTEAQGGVVPDCAMRVSRTSEVGPMASYMPAKSCQCAYDAAATATTPDNCKSCQSNSDCTDPVRPHCNYKFCEM